MRTIFQTAVAALALIAMTGETATAATCARSTDIAALKTAALQQRLMVAALYCNDVAPYNRFVLAHRGELQNSDAALLSYFRRNEGERGYHRYKTALANGYSLDSIHATAAYCQRANATFDAAFAPQNVRLADFVATLAVPEADPFACAITEARAETVSGGSSHWAGKQH
jgi:hypothetical protein